MQVYILGETPKLTVDKLCRQGNEKDWNSRPKPHEELEVVVKTALEANPKRVKSSVV